MFHQPPPQRKHEDRGSVARGARRAVTRCPPESSLSLLRAGQARYSDPLLRSRMRPGQQPQARSAGPPSRLGPWPHRGPGRTPGSAALTSCCEEQGGVEIVGCQPFPLQGTGNKTNPLVWSPPGLHGLCPGVTGTGSPPRAPDWARTPLARGRHGNRYGVHGSRGEVGQPFGRRWSPP